MSWAAQTILEPDIQHLVVPMAVRLIGRLGNPAAISKAAVSRCGYLELRRGTARRQSQPSGLRIGGEVCIGPAGCWSPPRASALLAVLAETTGGALLLNELADRKHRHGSGRSTSEA